MCECLRVRAWACACMAVHVYTYACLCGFCVRECVCVRACVCVVTACTGDAFIQLLC